MCMPRPKCFFWMRTRKSWPSKCAVQLAEILSQIEGLEEPVPYFAPDEKRRVPRTTTEVDAALARKCHLAVHDLALKGLPSCHIL